MDYSTIINEISDLLMRSYRSLESDCKLCEIFDSERDALCEVIIILNELIEKEVEKG